MGIKVQEIVSKDYTEVVILWNDVLGVSTVTGENFRVTMDQMIRADNYKTFVALLENHVVGFISMVHALALGSANGYLHITGLAVHNDFQRHKVGTELLRYTENYAKDSGMSSIISPWSDYCMRRRT
jgi:ribosomal protein S18 acetylase RimI-like enzyme